MQEEKQVGYVDYIFFKDRCLLYTRRALEDARTSRMLKLGCVKPFS
jgi:hypothetical protein